MAVLRADTVVRDHGAPPFDGRYANTHLRFLASTHYTHYNPWLFAINMSALILVLIPKLPQVISEYDAVSLTHVHDYS